jgi:putative ABC transport system permease protein
MSTPVWPLLKTFSLQELLHHTWRNAAALVSVMLGVALAFSVHLINASALDEFSQALRSVGGQPDLELRSSSLQGHLDEGALGLLLQHPDVALASPLLELNTYALLTHCRLPRSRPTSCLCQALKKPARPCLPQTRYF